ncbi:MAG: PH domain-containing protein [Gemmatimonadaceae bacterium]
MSYIESQLLPNERIVARTSRNKIVLILPTLLVLLFAAATVVSLVSHQAIGLVVVPLVIAVLIGGIAWLTYKSADFAVTTSRLILKQGLISRRTLELQLNKVEAVNVDQSLFGRMLGYGTLQVSGTGGTKEVFSIVNHPDAFRTAVQAQINVIYAPAAYQQASIESASASAPARAERQCPYCAETILAAAKICRFCNRDVSASPV